MGQADATTVGDRLRRARRRRFVGRAGEIELFSAALAAADPAFAVLYVHGPGGVGKSSLLGEFAELARAAGKVPVALDARVVQPSPAAFLAGLSAALGAAEGRSPLDSLTGGHLVLLDTYELLAPLDDWIREEFLPALPASAMVVIAGRHPPAQRWASDPGWRELLRVVPLRNLLPDETVDYLRVENVRDGLHRQVLTMTHGHPLTLSLLVDMLGRRRDADEPVPRALADALDVVGALLGSLVDQAPGPRYRAALEVCAHVRFTTEELLRAALAGDDAHELFGWLRTLSIIEEGPYGLYPHDVARDVLEADLRWRDWAGYADLHRRLRAHLVGRIREATGDERDRQRLVADVLFLGRAHPIISGHFELVGLDGAYVDDLRPTDAAAVLDMTARRQGDEQAALAEYWMKRQPAAFRVFRDAARRLIGYGACLALHEADEADLDADPAVRALWGYARRHDPPRGDEQMRGWTFFVDTEDDAGPSRSVTLLRLWFGQEAITRTTCSWDFTCMPAEREDWAPLLIYFDFHPAPEAAYEIGGRRYMVFAHDWRRVGVEEWLELTADRDLGAPVAAPAGAAPELVLSEPEFAEAVRAALRDLHRPDRLAGNPLLRSRLVGRRDGGEPAAEALRLLVGEAAGALRTDPRDQSLYRVVDRTFLRPAPTQERAAELLGLPFSTYRRHRNRGVERVIAWLWQRELHGR